MVQQNIIFCIQQNFRSLSKIVPSVLLWDSLAELRAGSFSHSGKTRSLTESVRNLKICTLFSRLNYRNVRNGHFPWDAKILTRSSPWMCVLVPSRLLFRDKISNSLHSKVW